MSLTKQRPSPLSDWFDADALLPNTLHATPIFLIRSAQIGTIQGHTYGQAGITINTTGTALPHLGDSHTMCKQIATAHTFLQLCCDQQC